MEVMVVNRKRFRWTPGNKHAAALTAAAAALTTADKQKNSKKRKKWAGGCRNAAWQMRQTVKNSSPILVWHKENIHKHTESASDRRQETDCTDALKWTGTLWLVNRFSVSSSQQPVSLSGIQSVSQLVPEWVGLSKCTPLRLTSVDWGKRQVLCQCFDKLRAFKNTKLIRQNDWKWSQ